MLSLYIIYIILYISRDSYNGLCTAIDLTIIDMDYIILNVKVKVYQLIDTNLIKGIVILVTGVYNNKCQLGIKLTDTSNNKIK